MANTYNNLSDLFTAIADSLRAKKNSTETIVADIFPTEIDNLRTGFKYNNSEVTSIPDYFFYCCEDLKNVNCYNLTSVGVSAFENCSNLKTVILWNNVETIGENAFKGCSNLTIYCEATEKPDTWNANWNPDNCEVVWGYAPVQTWDISATEEDNVTAKLYNDIDNEGYYSLIISGNGNMKECNTVTQPWSEYIRNITFVIITDGVTSIGHYAFRGCNSLTSVVIPDSVTYVGNYAFSACSSLTSITIPDSVKGTGGDAFSGCSSLTSVTISNSLTLISSSAFYGCSSLASIEIPNSVTNIGSWAFSGCSSLTSITIPDSVTIIGKDAFWDCSKRLESITVGSGNTKYHSDGNCLIETATKTLVLGCKNSSIPTDDSVTIIGKGAFFDCISLTSITIPDSVTNIGSWAFCSCSNLTSIEIPDSVTSIGENSFWDCRSLTSINIPDSVTSIGDQAFLNCSGLTSVTIGNSVTSIGREAFESCNRLTSITIPNSVTSIGKEAFYNCSKIRSVTFNGTTTQWSIITKGDNWKYQVPATYVQCSDGQVTLQ